MNKVYLDNAATTPLRKEVITKMTESLSSCFGNPSSTHSFGRQAKNQVEKARKTIAAELCAQASEIIFTSGGTEADNMILKAAVRDLGVSHIISSEMEHHAVLHTIEELVATHSIVFHKVRITSDGHIDLSDLERLLQQTPPKKTLVSLMHVNNETGNLLPVEKVAQLCQFYGAFFHSDTVQSIGHYHWDTQKVAVDFMTASAHKFHGPKGVGFAFIRKNSGLQPFITGGAQERGLRAGTEAVHNIVGMEEAFVQAYRNLDKERSYIEGLKSYFVEQVKAHLPSASFNGTCEDFERSSYTVVNVSLPMAYEKGQILLFTLDLNGIACSRGSACQSGSTQVSHVLKAFMTPQQLETPSLRFSFSHYNTTAEIDYVIRVLRDFITN